MAGDTEVTPGGDTSLELGGGSSSDGSKLSKNKYLIAGAVGVGLLGVAYLYKKKKDATATAATSTSTATTTPATTVDYPTTSDGVSSADASQYYDALATAIQNGVSTVGTDVSGSTDTLSNDIAGSTATTASNISAGTSTVTGAVSSAQQQIDQQISQAGASAPTPAPTPVQTASAAYPDPPITTLAGASYYVLGQGSDANGQYTDNQQWQVSNGAPVFFTTIGNGTPTQGPPPTGYTGPAVAYTPTSTPKSEIFGPNQQAIQ